MKGEIIIPVAFTPGPWNWEVRPKSKHVTLENARTNVVMDFVRWGMQGAQPRFINDGLLSGVESFCEPIPGREHHEWEKQINHPDSELIRLAPEMASEIKRLRAEIKWYREQMGLEYPKDDFVTDFHD